MENKTQNKNKQSYIIAAIIVVVSLIFVAAGVIFLTNNTDTGKNVKNEALGSSTFTPVQLPANSTDLTQVPAPEPNKPDKVEDPHIGVDMLGQRISHDDENGNGRPVEPRDREKPQDQTTTVKAGDSQRNKRISERTRKMKQVSNVGKRFVIENVGLDVPLGAINEVDGIIKPTNYTSAFMIRNHGVPYWQTNKGTSYIAMHALDNGGIAPGNFIIDMNTKKSRVNKGDIIKIGTKKFEIDKSERIGKGVITTRKDIWSKDKNRLIIITCFPNSNDNFVTFAHPVRG